MDSYNGAACRLDSSSRVFTRRSILAGAAAGAIGTVGRAGDSGSRPSDKTTVDRDWPVLTMWRNGGHRADSNEGLSLAVWDDGTLLLSPLTGKLGEHMLRGAVEIEDLHQVLKRIREGGYFRLKRDYLVPDSAYVTLAVRDQAATAVHSFHEYLLPGFGGDISTDADYRAFVRTWKQARGAVETLAPTRLERLDNAELRGYDPRAWRRTRWLRAEAWRERSSHETQ